MASAETVQVTGPGGLRGTIDTVAWPLDSSRAEVLIQFEGGTSMLVPRDTLARQDDGSYHLTLDSAIFEQRGAGGRVRDASIVLPVTQETLEVHTTPVETGHIRIRKVVHTREEVVDPPLLRDEVAVERVPINRIVEGPISARSEGHSWVIPLLEEALVVEKRLLLKEELRITKRRVETHLPQRVMLRREEAIVERVKAGPNHSEDDNNAST
jgi:uncharacterized protein (TIGR02271 family)